MAVDTRHPEITAEVQADWRLMRDAAGGQRSVKAAGITYLPKPGGFNAQPDGGVQAYEAYKARAGFPEILRPSISAMVGIIHAKEINIQMPDAMALIWENADGDGTPLEAFHRRITRALLQMGRFGLLTDAPENGGEPYLRGYAAETVINWDRDWFVLDESYRKRDGFQWDTVKRYRVLELVDGRYQTTVYEGNDMNAGRPVLPAAQGGAALTVVPFVVGSARDVTPEIEPPPLVGVANAAIAIYQLDADRRHQLFMSGQETLVAINGPAPEIVGAGVVHEMRGDGDEPDLKYVSPSCKGIDAHKEAMDDQARQAVMAGARMFEAERSQESGEARRLRFASETASLMSVAQVSCAMLERGLRFAALMKGLKPDDVIVPPPADLLDSTMNPQDLATLFGVYQQGGMSWQTYYDNAQKGGLMSPERDADAEFELIDGQGDDGI